MRTAIFAVAVTTGFLYAQARRSLLLPENRWIRGTVVDSSGKPIVGARIDHTNYPYVKVRTDAEGYFELSTPAPGVIVRSAGYQSQRIAVSDARIVLQTANRRLPMCPRTEPCESIEGWGAAFCFPRVPGVTATRQGQDVDYGARAYTISGTRVAIRHASGPLWGDGLPFNDDVWRSTEYQETVFGEEPLITIDARGRTADGKFWRNLGRFGESASYVDVDEASAEMLDRVLDGVCIRQSR